MNDRQEQKEDFSGICEVCKRPHRLIKAFGGVCSTSCGHKREGMKMAQEQIALWLEDDYYDGDRRSIAEEIREGKIS